MHDAHAALRGVPGGSARLEVLTTLYFGAIEADFAATYGVDLRRALWGPERLGVRRILALVDGLPAGGALHRARDPKGWRWTDDTELLAGVLGASRLAVRVLWALGHLKGSAPEWKPIRRPWDSEPGAASSPAGPKRMSTTAELKRFFGRGNA